MHSTKRLVLSEPDFVRETCIRGLAYSKAHYIYPT